MYKTFARRLEDFRRMLGLSQEQLAKKVECITKAAIEKFENAEMMPAPQTLSKLAEVLGVSTDDLVRPYFVDINYDKMRYRKRSKMPKKDVVRLQRFYGNKLERYMEIEQIQGVVNPFTMNYDQIEVKTCKDAQVVARLFRRDMGWGLNPIASPIHQLELKGVKIFMLDENDSDNKDFDGMCYKCHDVAFLVMKKGENTERDRFTLFHEMGHLLLNVRDMEDGRELEKICDAFASEVLLPEEMFRTLFYGQKIYPATLQMIQREWGISCDAQMYKAKNLGIISENRYIGYKVRLNRNPNLKEEMMQSRFPTEVTDRFESLVHSALSEYKITQNKADSLLGINNNK